MKKKWEISNNFRGGRDVMVKPTVNPEGSTSKKKKSISSIQGAEFFSWKGSI